MRRRPSMAMAAPNRKRRGYTEADRPCRPREERQVHGLRGQAGLQHETAGGLRSRQAGAEQPPHPVGPLRLGLPGQIAVRSASGRYTQRSADKLTGHPRVMFHHPVQLRPSRADGLYLHGGAARGPGADPGFRIPSEPGHRSRLRRPGCQLPPRRARHTELRQTRQGCGVGEPGDNALRVVRAVVAWDSDPDMLQTVDALSIVSPLSSRRLDELAREEREMTMTRWPAEANSRSKL